MSKYEKVFKKVLIERGDADVWNDSFENPEMTDQFQTQPIPSEIQSGQIEKAKGWVKRLDSFADWINGTEIDSLNKQFVALDKEGSIFEGISGHSKKLIGIAADLAALAETIKGYILTADKKNEDNARNNEIR